MLAVLGIDEKVFDAYVANLRAQETKRANAREKFKILDSYDQPSNGPSILLSPEDHSKAQRIQAGRAIHEEKMAALAESDIDADSDVPTPPSIDQNVDQSMPKHAQE